MKKIICVFLLATSLFGQSAGNSGLAFLKFGFGARNVALSDLGVVGTNDLTALNYNPADLAAEKNNQLLFTHNSLFTDLSAEMFGASFNLWGLPLALGINTTNISDIEVRTTPGPAEATFSAHYFNGSISTAHEIAGNLYAGVTFKYLYENMYSDDAEGYGFDIGLTYQKLVEGLNLGASVRNLGSMNILRSESTKLPADLLIGASYNFAMPDSKFDFTVLTGLQKYTLEDGSHFHIGGEAVYNNMFALRAGYVGGYDSKSLTTGFGIKWIGLNLDYAYVPVKYGLGDSHIITFIYTFE